MEKSTTLKRFYSAFGGLEFIVTGNSETVRYKCRSPKENTFRTFATSSREEFDAFADHVGLYDPYNDNPAHIGNLWNEYKCQGHVDFSRYLGDFDPDTYWS